MTRLSISQAKLFKACRRAWQFKYIEHLEPVAKSDALITGSNYHALLEELYKTSTLRTYDFSKESAMACAFEKYIYPHFNVKAAEEWREKPLLPDVLLCGRLDGLANDGNLVEHKTTSKNLDEYEYFLQWDEQILAYMFLTGARQAYYTVCRKPNIRQKKNESDADFFERMKLWYDEDTDQKIRYMLITRTDEQVERFYKQFIWLADEIRAALDFPERHCYCNTAHCDKWGRLCEYASVCLDYDPDADYVEFIKRR